MNRRRALATGLIAMAVIAPVAALAARPADPIRIEITMRLSHYEPSNVTVPAGRAVTFVLRNADPIDHEWIVGDEAVHAIHRAGTEQHHGNRATEISIDAITTTETTVTFATAGTLTYVCHLPGHEAYGMTGTLTVSRG